MNEATSSGPSARRVFFIVCLVMIAAWVVLPFTGPVDDAYITMTYSRHWAAGQGIVFNAGENVEGCTAFGLMAILAAFSAAGIARLPAVAVVLGILSWAGALALVWNQYRRERRESFADKPATIDTAVALFLLTTPAVLVWTCSAMETPLVALLFAVGWSAHLREHERNRVPWASALAAVGAGLMRPDGILLAVPLFLSWLLPKSDRRIKPAAIFAAIVFGVFGAYWLWRWRHFGYLMPNTFAAKVGTTSLSLATKGLQYWLAAVIAWAFPVLLIWRAIKVGRTGRAAWNRRVWTAVGLAAVMSAYVIVVGGDFFPFHRFLVPVLGPGAFAAWRVVRQWREERAAAMGRTPEAAPRLRAAIGLAALWWMWSAGTMALDVYKAGRLVKWTEDWGQVGRTLKAETPDDTLIATLPIGALGYYSNRRILDMVGLVDLHIGRKDIRTGHSRQGHEKFDTGYVLSREPDIILTWPERYEGVPRKREWQFSHTVAWAQRDLYLSPATLAAYAPMKFESKGKTVLGLLRRDHSIDPAWNFFRPLNADVVQSHFSIDTFRNIQRPTREELTSELPGMPSPTPDQTPALP